MSISNRHPLSLFVAGESKPMSGQRLAKVGYKQTEAMTKRGETAPDSVCASLPQIPPEDITANITRLLPYICTMLENAQDGIVRSLYESADHTLISISDDDISVDQCISFMAAEAAGDRLSKDAVLAWFDAEIRENLAVMIAEKLGFDDMGPDQMPVINKHVGVYREVIGTLASGKTTLAQKQINGCRSALKLVQNPKDRICAKLSERLDLMEKKQITEFLV